MAYVNSTTHTQTDAHMHHVLEYHIKRYKLYLLLLLLLSPSETNQCNQYPCLLIYKQTNTHSSLFKTVVEYSWPRFGPVVPCWGPTRTCWNQSLGIETDSITGTVERLEMFTKLSQSAPWWIVLVTKFHLFPINLSFFFCSQGVLKNKVLKTFANYLFTSLDYFDNN
jgi:hypothetical protein